jgi:hypothetical protein
MGTMHGDGGAKEVVASEIAEYIRLDIRTG